MNICLCKYYSADEFNEKLQLYLSHHATIGCTTYIYDINTSDRKKLFSIVKPLLYTEFSVMRKIYSAPLELIKLDKNIMCV